MSSIINNVFPCPFCGNQKLKVECKTKRLYYPTTSIQATCSVRCNCCHARGGTITKVYQVTQWKGDTHLEQQAIRKWNKRYAKFVNADVVIERMENVIEWYSHKTAGDFDKGRALGLKEAIEIIVDEYTLNDVLDEE